jgi:hypothetical protein
MGGGGYHSETQEFLIQDFSSKLYSWVEIHNRNCAGLKTRKRELST